MCKPASCCVYLLSKRRNCHDIIVNWCQDLSSNFDDQNGDWLFRCLIKFGSRLGVLTLLRVAKYWRELNDRSSVPSVESFINNGQQTYFHFQNDPGVMREAMEFVCASGVRDYLVNCNLSPELAYESMQDISESKYQDRVKMEDERYAYETDDETNNLVLPDDCASSITPVKRESVKRESSCYENSTDDEWQGLDNESCHKSLANGVKMPEKENVPASQERANTKRLWSKLELPGRSNQTELSQVTMAAITITQVNILPAHKRSRSDNDGEQGFGNSYWKKDGDWNDRLHAPVYDCLESSDTMSYPEMGDDVKSALDIARVLASIDDAKQKSIDTYWKSKSIPTYWKSDGHWSDELHRLPNKFPYIRGVLQQKMWAAYGKHKRFIPSPYADRELYKNLSIADRAVATMYYSYSDLSSSESDSSDDD